MASSIIGQLRVILGLDTAAYEKGLSDAQREMARSMRKIERLGHNIENVGKSISLAVTLPILAVGGAALGMAAKFESAMNRVEAATGATGRQLDALKQKAIAIGKDKSFTATAAQTADVMEMLAKNGLNVTQILGGATEATLKFAAANGAEFAPSADAVTDILQQFGRDVSELPGIVDKMTGAMLVSKMGFDDYRLAIGQAGGVAGGLGQSFEDMNVVLAASASLFASGSDAGTSYKTFLTSLPGKSKEAKAAIEQYGLSFFDAQGNMKSMGEIAQSLQDRLGGLNDEARGEVLTTIFGTDAMRTAIGLMNQGADGLARVRGEINKASAQTQMEARMKGWSGAITQVKKAFEAAAIAMGDSGILGALTRVLTLVAATIGAFADLPAPIQFAIGGMLGLTAAVGPLLIVGGKAIQMWAGLTVMLVGRFVPAAAATAVATTATGTAAAGSAVGFAALRGAMAFMMGPWGVVIGGIALALWGVSRGTSAAAAETNKYNTYMTELRKRAADAKKSVDDYGSGLGGAIKQMMDAAREAAKLASQFYNVETAAAAAMLAMAKTRAKEKWDALNKANESDQRSPFARSRGVAKGSTVADRAVRMRATEQFNRAAKDVELAQAEFDRRLAAQQNGVKPPAAPSPTNPAPANDNGTGGGSGKGGGGKSGPSKEELAARREEMRLQAEIQAAQLRGDEATAQRLQDQLDLKRQIKDYEDAGLSAAEAKNAAEADHNAILAARRVAVQRELEDQRASVEMEIARLSDDEARVQQLEREQEIKDRILFFEQQLLDIADEKLRLERATAMAMEQQARVDAARAAGRAKWMAQDEAQRQIALMKARGDSEESIRQAERRYDIERRIEQLKVNGMAEGAAREQAMAEDAAAEMARQQGQWRDTFKGAIRAAMDGDLKGFAKNWWKEQMARGMENALNSISDFLFGLFRQAFGQGAGALGGGGGGGGLFGTILGGLGSIFGPGTFGSGPNKDGTISLTKTAGGIAKTVGFKDGTSGWMKPVGGMAGVDRQLVSFRMSSNEEFAVRRKGEVGGPVGGGNVYQFTGNLMTPEFWATIDAKDMATGSNAVGTTERRAALRRRRALGR